MMGAAIRSALLVNRASLVGAFVVVSIATALLTATGAWLQAGWTAAELASSSMLSALASSFAGTTLIIAVFIVASTVSTALRGRRREFALLRAVGATVAQVRQQISAEVLVVVLAAAPVGAVAGSVLAPSLTPLLAANGIVPADFALPFSPLSIIVTVAVLIPTALIAGRLAARESARLSPTAAVQQSSHEPATISRGRRIAAAATAAAGLIVAVTPLFTEGILGAASGASSVFLMIVATALAGPILVSAVSTRAATATASNSSSALVLAAANARGFSRRYAAVIVPLALLLSLGAVQSGVGVASAAATGAQLEQALGADLVVVGDGGMAPDAEAIAERSGVVAVAQTSTVAASVRVDEPDEDVPFLTEIGWEPTAIRTVTPVDSALFDPGVTAGSLDALQDEGTIAVSSDAIVFTGKGIGDSVDVRLGGGDETAARIVAIYDNALGVGNYLMAHDPDHVTASSTVVLVQTASDSADAVRAALESDGVVVLSLTEYVDAAQAGSGDQQQLSNILLFALLAFIAVAALQALATSISERRAEFELLRRSGATRAQLTAMIAVEAVFVGAGALTLGVLAALPALVGFGIGMLGNPFAAFDPLLLGALAVVVSVLPVVTMVVVGRRSMARRS
ncbi:ABC transporter permease [Microbacterium sp.]|uniref:FtsX-like permease family protein n=1 Tax=Microbacterium sp. TaxID=51671 RepID=UPI0026136203|nr:ABC transporter permease [Microbacterium sp.]